jgi:hypothetical protein
MARGRKPPTLSGWQFGELFGTKVVRGFLGAERVTAPWVFWVGWRGAGKVGIRRAPQGPHEEVWRLGAPGPAPYGVLEPWRATR